MPAVDPRAVLRLLVHVDDTKFRTTVDPRATVHRLLVKIESEYAALMAGREPVVCLRLKDADGCLLPGTLTVGDVLAPDAAVVVVNDGGTFTAAKAAEGREWSVDRILAQWSAWQAFAASAIAAAAASKAARPSLTQGSVPGLDACPSLLLGCDARARQLAAGACAYLASDPRTAAACVARCGDALARCAAQADPADTVLLRRCAYAVRALVECAASGGDPALRRWLQSPALGPALSALASAGEEDARSDAVAAMRAAGEAGTHGAKAGPPAASSPNGKKKKGEEEEEEEEEEGALRESEIEGAAARARVVVGGGGGGGGGDGDHAQGGGQEALGGGKVDDAAPVPPEGAAAALPPATALSKDELTFRAASTGGRVVHQDLGTSPDAVLAAARTGADGAGPSAEPEALLALLSASRRGDWSSVAFAMRGLLGLLAPDRPKHAAEAAGRDALVARTPALVTRLATTARLAWDAGQGGVLRPVAEALARVGTAPPWRHAASREPVLWQALLWIHTRSEEEEAEGVALRALESMARAVEAGAVEAARGGAGAGVHAHDGAPRVPLGSVVNVAKCTRQRLSRAGCRALHALVTLDEEASLKERVPAFVALAGSPEAWKRVAGTRALAVASRRESCRAALVRHRGHEALTRLLAAPLAGVSSWSIGALDDRPGGDSEGRRRPRRTEWDRLAGSRASVEQAVCRDACKALANLVNQPGAGGRAVAAAVQGRRAGILAMAGKDAVVGTFAELLLEAAEEQAGPEVEAGGHYGSGVA